MGCRVGRGNPSNQGVHIACHRVHSTIITACLQEEIHKRIYSELPAFDQQLSSSKYVQERLQALQTNVDNLSTTLSHPEVGNNFGLYYKCIQLLTRQDWFPIFFRR